MQDANMKDTDLFQKEVEALRRRLSWLSEREGWCEANEATTTLFVPTVFIFLLRIV